MNDSDSINSILADLRQKYVEEPGAVSSNSAINPTPSKKQQHPTLDIILNELKQGCKVSYFSEKMNKVQAGDKQLPQSLNSKLNPELKKLIDYQEKQRQAIITQKAQQWLEQLDPLSGEGIWFADLAKHYPSTLAAAIALLINESA
jgi:septal ring factor EnvC (AmiA/AmiB activator)